MTLELGDEDVRNPGFHAGRASTGEINSRSEFRRPDRNRGIQREQWDDGNNVVALEPGVVIAHVTYIDPTSSQIGHKESMKDTARVLGRMYDAIEYRGAGQKIVEELAEYAATRNSGRTFRGELNVLGRFGVGFAVVTSVGNGGQRRDRPLDT